MAAVATRRKGKPRIPAGVHIDDRTHDMEEKVVLCRADSHWKAREPSPVERRAEIANMARQGLRERHLKCLRCSTEWTLLIDTDGYVVSNRVKYPEGYLVPAGTGRLSRAAARNAADYLF